MNRGPYFSGLRQTVRNLRFSPFSRRLPEHPAVPGLGIRWWTDFFALVEHPAQETVVCLPQLVAPLDRIPRHPKSGQRLVAASRFAIAHGLFSLGGAMRLAGRGILLECLAEGRLGPGSPLYLPAMAALVEAGRWEEFIDAMMRLPLNRGHDRQAMGTLLATMAPVTLTKAHPQLAEPLPQDPAFVDFVAGKRVAVVGPASSTAGQGHVIDRYDLVARFNYKEEGIGLDPLHKGERCDLVYFNRAQTEHLLTHGDLSRFPHAPAWVITRRQKHADALCRALEAEATCGGAPPWEHHYRSTPVYEVPLFCGLFTAAPNAILDLLHGGAGAVDVFHVDFMLTVERTRNYNPLMQDLTDATRITVKSFAGPHDPLTQLAMMKTAWRCGRVHGDEPFLSALRLGEQEYMDALQRLYGNAVLKIIPV